MKRLLIPILGTIFLGCGSAPLPNDGASSPRAPSKTDKAIGMAHPSSSPSTSETKTPEIASPEVVLQEGHRDTVDHIAISPDSRFILTVGRDDTLKLFSREQGLLLRTFVMISPYYAEISPDNRHVVGVAEGKVVVFELATGEKIRVIDLKGDSPDHVCFFSDGRRIVVAFKGTRFEIWDLLTGVKIREIKGSERNRGKSAVVLSQDEKTLISGYRDGAFRVFDINAKEKVFTYKIHKGDIRSVRFIQDDRVVSVANTHKHGSLRGPWDIVIWNPLTGKSIEQFSVNQNAIGLSVLPDGKRAVAITEAKGWQRNTILYIDLKTETVLRRFNNRKNATRPMALSPDGSYAVSTADSGYDVFVWGIRDEYASPVPKEEKNLISKPDKVFFGAVRNKTLATAQNSWRAVIRTEQEGAYVWDLEKMLMDHRKERIYRNDQFALSPNGKVLATGKLIWDAEQGDRLGKLGMERRRFGSGPVVFSPDSTKVSMASSDLGVLTWNLTADKELEAPKYLAELTTLENQRLIHFTDIAYSQDGRHILVGGEKTLLIRARDFSAIRMFRHYAHRVRFFPDGRRVLIASLKDGPMVWTTHGDKPEFTYRDETSGQLVDCDLSPDGTRLAVINTQDGIDTLTVWDTSRQKKLHQYQKDGVNLKKVRFLPSSKHVITLSNGNSAHIWNLENGRTAALMAQGDEWVVLTDEGYFDASRRGGHLLALVTGTRGFRIDQLATKYNRPDLVLSYLGLGSPKLIAHYYEMFLKRLRKLGIEEDEVDNVFAMAPTVSIEKAEYKGKWIRLTVDMTATGSPLSSYNLYANDVPIYGLMGRPIQGREKKVRMIVELTDGSNKLEVSAINEMGIESLRDKYTTYYTGPKMKHDLYYLAFGVSQYKNTDLNLKYAAKDAREIEAVFREVHANYNRVYSKVYTDQAVTVEAIAKAKSFLKASKVDDTVVLFVAGHGLYEMSNEEQYYYLIHTTDIDNLKDTAVPFRLIEDLLSNIKPRRKLFLLDTCQSGELDELEETHVLASAETRGLIHRGIRKKGLRRFGRVRTLKKYLEEREQRYIYNDLTRRTGAMVLSSSRGNEFSYEKDELQNGVFTQEVFNAFTTNKADRDKNKKLTIDELRDYVFRSVSKYTGGLQHPVVDRDNLELEFEFPIIKSATPGRADN
ncbi:MAG: hypothetical protein GY854_23430 [Deltaproteobacteria bacterium]|nr:hypothetical protein [Deltaproteobacteria bacterium]